MFKTILLTLTIGLLSFPAPAYALGECDGIEKEKKRAKCEAKAAEALARLRAHSRPYKPSRLGEAFAGLDGENNPFNTDAYFLGVQKTRIKKLDRFNNKVNRIVATLRMAQYIGELNETDPEQAAQLGAALLPKLIALKDEAMKAKKRGQRLIEDPTSLIENPTQTGRALSSLKNSVSNLAQVLTDLPSVLSAIEPIAKGAADNLVGTALDQAGEMVGVDNATEALETAKSTIEDAQSTVQSTAATVEKSVETVENAAEKAANETSGVNAAREAAKARARQMAEEAKKAAKEEDKD